MKAWIEISSEIRFQKKIDGISGLYAPAGTRYIHMLEKVNKGDIVLHHITTQGSKKKENRSAIIGISIIESPMILIVTRISVELRKTIQLPKPIKLSDVVKIKNKSDLLVRLLHFNLQAYLGEISVQDVKNILTIHEENRAYLQNLDEYKNLIDKRLF